MKLFQRRRSFIKDSFEIEIRRIHQYIQIHEFDTRSESTNIYKSTNDFVKMKKEIVYKELSYKLNGILFTVHNELGRYRNEKQYCDLIEKYLKDFNIPYEREKILPVSFVGEKRGRSKVDFMIDGKILLEVKSKPFLEKSDYYQARRYLVSCKKRLAILVNFHQRYIAPKRVLSGYE